MKNDYTGIMSKAMTNEKALQGFEEFCETCRKKCEKAGAKLDCNCCKVKRGKEAIKKQIQEKPKNYEETIVWHEIVTRPLTQEEREEYGKFGVGYAFDCFMPEDGQDIIVATYYGVDTDICAIDKGYYLERLGDWNDVIAWAEMPKYKS